MSNSEGKNGTETVVHDRCYPAEKLVYIPNPDCYECDGCGWYEGGPAICTPCSCRRVVLAEEAHAFVTHGSYQDWKQLYTSGVSAE